MTKLYDAQQAVFRCLKADNELRNSVTGVYDYVPDSTEFPYIVLGRVYSTPAPKTKTSEGETIEVTLDVWSTYKGKKETSDIVNLIKSALLSEEFEIDEADVIDQEIKSIEILEEDNELFHGTVVFEIILDME
ncbi:DUF3168 domain-containing protein [Evansella cellulosilytica]|uniref:DUF3168 domain-containing protein n=1 Tax=Evansella cellulosilytica (strain ATCC 21833 / DSM 2522 / FERM P-1141 / JCM 9156 / N-4) TaxID=649639 RepID=E6U1K0_EVAC2|nr:DUF3168 domain-containing protein [Evansella cellulosilytica]ADU30363.1 hypothetical protein Bcell_2102 [Evansella cellulosilytica DSM 2522]